MTCIMDFPEAWQFVRPTDPKDHDPNCSWRVRHGGLLCDCHILMDEYARREAALCTENVQPSLARVLPSITGKTEEIS